MVEDHDREIFIDEDRKPTAPELAENQVFRYELLNLLDRIVKALENIENGIVHIKGEY